MEKIKGIYIDFADYGCRVEVTYPIDETAEKEGKIRNRLFDENQKTYYFEKPVRAISFVKKLLAGIGKE